MKIKLLVYITIICYILQMLYASHISYAQLTEWTINTPDYKRTLFVKPYLHFPPIQSGMPFEVTMGYRVIDSLVKSADYFDMYNHALQMPKDSLVLALRYYNEVLCYDPLLFEVYSIDLDSVAHKMRPQAAFNAVRDAYSQRFGLGAQDSILLEIPYILHVQVVGREHDVLTDQFDANQNYDSYCSDSYVIDKIKGEKIHSNCNLTDMKNTKSDMTSDCVRNWWLRTHVENPVPGADTLYQWWGKYGEDFMKVDGEYIVFLYYTLDDFQDGSGRSHTLVHARHDLWIDHKQERVAFVFEINNGKVHDQLNFWGMGEYVDLNTFKNFLRTRLNQLLDL